jgi:hypothetical protein
MHTDFYTRVMLTIIAVSLAGIAFRPFTSPNTAEAQPRGVVDVRIRGIDEASNLRWEAIRVICEKCK